MLEMITGFFLDEWNAIANASAYKIIFTIALIMWGKSSQSTGLWENTPEKRETLYYRLMIITALAALISR